MAHKQLVKVIATLLDARLNCINNGNFKWEEKHTNRILKLIKKYLPSGSGFDAGTDIDFDKSTSDKLVFDTQYHHMDEDGHYKGWTYHTIVVKSSFIYDTVMTISGKNQDGIKESIAIDFQNALTSFIKE